MFANIIFCDQFGGGGGGAMRILDPPRTANAFSQYYCYYYISLSVYSIVMYMYLKILLQTHFNEHIFILHFYRMLSIFISD